MGKNTVYTRKGLGRPLSYGEMDANFSVLSSLATDGVVSLASSTDYAVVVSDSYQTFFQEDDNGDTTGTTIQYDYISYGTDGITLDQDNNGNYTQITVSDDGVYEIIIQMNVFVGNAATGGMWLLVNGDPVSGSTEAIGVSVNKNSFVSTINTYLLQLSAGDSVSTWCATTPGFAAQVIAAGSQFNLNPSGHSIMTTIKKINGTNVMTGAYIESQIFSTGLTNNTYNITTDDAYKSLLINSPYDGTDNAGAPIYVNLPSTDFAIGTKIKVTNFDDSGSMVVITGDPSQVIFTSLDGWYINIPTYLPVMFLSCELTYLGIVNTDGGNGKGDYYSWYVERIGNVFTDYLQPNFIPVSSNYQDFGYNDEQGSSGTSGQVGNPSTSESYQQLVSSGIKTNNFYTMIADNYNLSNIMGVFATANSINQFPGISVQIGAINSGNTTRIVIDDDAQMIDLTNGATKVGKFVSVDPYGSTFQYDGSSGTWSPSTNLKTIIFDMNNYNGQVNSYGIEFDDVDAGYSFTDGQEVSIRIINPAVNAFTVYVNSISGTVTFEGQSSLSLDAHRAFSINGTVASGTMIGVNMLYVAANNNFVILSYV